MWADVAVIPCKASMFEARALAKNTSFVRQAQAIRGGLPNAVAVLSMVGRDYRLTRDMVDAAVSIGLDLASTPITLRQAYADARTKQVGIQFGLFGTEAARRWGFYSRNSFLLLRSKERCRWCSQIGLN